MKQIATALVKAQLEMGNPVKDAKNPFFKSTYADLNSVREAVLPTLNKHGICVLQPQVHIDGKNFVKTMLIHESGETLEGLTEIIYNKANDAQAQGSGITYARRYGLQSMACVGADDDDGNKASQPTRPEPAKQAVAVPSELDWVNLQAIFDSKKDKIDADKFDGIKKAVEGKNPKHYDYTLNTLKAL